VLGLSAWFIHLHRQDDSSPIARVIYTTVISCIALLVSLVWLLPFTYTFMHYPFDLLMSAAWFAAFGLLVVWINDINCGAAFHWGGIYHGGQCNQWKAAEAFTFIGACFWLASALLVSCELLCFVRIGMCPAANFFLRASTCTTVLSAVLDQGTGSKVENGLQARNAKHLFVASLVPRILLVMRTRA